MLRSLHDVKAFEKETSKILGENFNNLMVIAKDARKMSEEDNADATAQLKALYDHVLAFARRELEVKSYCDASKKVSIC